MSLWQVSDPRRGIDVAFYGKAEKTNQVRNAAPCARCKCSSQVARMSTLGLGGVRGRGMETMRVIALSSMSIACITPAPEPGYSRQPTRTGPKASTEPSSYSARA